MNDRLSLVDSSAWIEVIDRRQPPAGLRRRLDEILEHDRAATTGMVRLELLRGASDQTAFDRLGSLLSSLHQLPATEDRYSEAAALGRMLRRGGISIPSPDLLIAAVAIHAGAVLVHRDRHFDAIAAHAALAVESYVAA